jgi:hypothetical protein
MITGFRFRPGEYPDFVDYQMSVKIQTIDYLLRNTGVE